MNYSVMTGAASRSNNHRNDEWATETTTERTIHEGAEKEDVKRLVDSMLKDPSINISAIPDVVQRIIYKSTIRMTLNGFYKLFAKLDGLGLSSTNHQIQLHITRRQQQCDDEGYNVVDDDDDETNGFQHPRGNINKELLGKVADKLLSMKAINQRFIPDVIERQVYMSCLQVIFWIIHVVTSSVHLTICGHTIGMTLLNGSSRRCGDGDDYDEILLHRADTAADSLLSSMGKKQLKRMAEETGMMLDDTDRNVMNALPWVQQELLTKLHVSLYGLIVGIIDDMFATTRVRLLSDDISFRIVPKDNGEDHEDQRQYHSQQNYPHGNVVDTVYNHLSSLNFPQERDVLQRRFQQWTPEQRAAMIRDLQESMRNTF